MMQDVDGKTPMDLLADYAIGKPEAGIPADDQLLMMLDEFANSPVAEIDVTEVTTPAPVPPQQNGEQQAQPEQAPQEEQPAQQNGPKPLVEPQMSAEKSENEKTPEDAKHHPAPEARPQNTVPGKVTKSILEALLRL
jgi:outer membrane biosynthesis protein TonB